MRKYAIAALIVTVVAALTTGGMWAGAQTGTGGTGGTGGTLPEPTAVPATPVPPTPTVEPVMAAIGQLQAEVAILRTAVQNSNNIDGLVNEKLGALIAQLDTWPTEAEWDALLADWSAVTDVATQELLNITDAFALLNARISDQLSNQTGGIGICNGCMVTQ